jgi:hypothetical protein
MKPYLRITVVFAALLLALSFQAVAGAPVPGAIFTTDAGGTIVNANTQYTSKCDVYLDGGPGPHAKAGAAGLPAGEYFFQVTDASGQTLLSTDPANSRRFLVSGAGVITGYTGFGGPSHPTGIDQDHPELGAITIRLANETCPADYLNTPNNGSVYKVWVTPVTDFAGDPSAVDSPCDKGCFHGFLPSKSKTDNFKVQPAVTFCLNVTKQLVQPWGDVTPGFYWPVELTDPNGVTNNYFTNDTDGTVAICGLVAGSYTVAELPQDGYTPLGLLFNGVSFPLQTSHAFSWAPGQANPSVIFQNQPPQIY